MTDLLSLLPIVAIFLIFWLLVIRPASRRQKKLQSVQRALEIGDGVITSSGFFGTIRSLEDDKVGLEIATGVVVSVARAAIVGVPDAGDQPGPSAELNGEDLTTEQGQ